MCLTAVIHKIIDLLQENGMYTGWFWGYDELRARDFKCLSYQGMSSLITDLVVELNEKATFIERAETLLHDHFGDVDYWNCRRSMRFNGELVDVANEFRRTQLGSTDEKDKTLKPDKWEDHVVSVNPRQ